MDKRKVNGKEKRMVNGTQSGVARYFALLDLWAQLWGAYVQKKHDVQALQKVGLKGVKLSQPVKALTAAKEALLKDFPEAALMMD